MSAKGLAPNPTEISKMCVSGRSTLPPVPGPLLLLQEVTWWGSRHYSDFPERFNEENQDIRFGYRVPGCVRDTQGVSGLGPCVCHVLALLDDDGRYVLDADASDVAIGVLLSQVR